MRLYFRQALLCILKAQRRVCIDSRMLSTTVASPCQTLCELLAGDHELISPAHQLAVPRMPVRLLLTSRVFVRLTKDTTYLTGNEGQKYVRFSLKLLRCKARARKSQYAHGLPRSDRSACSAYLGGTRRCNAGRVSPLACYLVV